MIGYLGFEKSFTNLAAMTFYSNDELRSYKNIHHLLTALRQHKIDGFVVPMNYYLDGTTKTILDMVFDNEFHIAREIVTSNQYRLVSKNPKMSDIRRIIGSKESFICTELSLQQELKNYKEIIEASPLKALQYLEKMEDDVAVLVPKFMLSGDVHVLLDDINDIQKKKTKYYLIQKTLEVQRYHNKTIIVCAPRIDSSGSLYDILHEFAIRNINLSKIESKVDATTQGTFLFYLEFDGNIEENHIVKMIDILQYKTSYLKILGSFFSKK